MVGDISRDWRPHYRLEILIELINEPGTAWRACESALESRGAPLPLYHRAAWARAFGGSRIRHSLLSIRRDDKCVGAFAFEGAPSRTMPRHRLLSIQRLGLGAGGLDRAALEEGLQELVRRSREEWPVLRITVDAFSLDPELRAGTGDALRRTGFTKVPTTRSYERTLVLDLEPAEDTLFAGLHKNARQGIRNVARYPVQVTPVTDVSLAPRLQTLSDETRGRTGGERRELDWESIVRLSAESPELSRIAILERTDVKGPDAVLAFAWGCMHGNVGEYSESGSARPADLKVSTSYALLWDLVLWARRGGARWFDFGGITGGMTHSDDPLGGISDFKRRFAHLELEVGEQWELEPRPARARIARLVSRAAKAVRGGMRRPRL